MTGKQPWNKGLTRETDERVDTQAKSLIATLKISLPTGCFSKEWYGTEKARAASAKGGGYREKSGRSKKFITVDSFGDRVCLQSSYEKTCAEILDELNIQWIRPKHLMYDGRRYFADFYLPSYGLYLDPKNNYKAKIDEYKIDAVEKQNGVKIIVLLKEHLTKEFIADLVQR